MYTGTGLAGCRRQLAAATGDNTSGSPPPGGKTVFREVDRFSCELGVGEGTGYTIRAALLNGVKQAGGDETDIGEYRMDVYSIAEDDQVLLAGFTVPPDAVHRPAGSLAD
jgi:hypothetical protein